ncbi:hypothetical protein LPB140_04255 [Sphingorhabdus lutea]|uniref:DUF3168 domain-containing protein n=1 Tax=Sphingorhabdus lutea TaxID=1913578 RepID=A0A1L3JAJ9_9SPHN|nr:hypothetical protein [Sphingorhabdus lutea]APG62148.1 hypothetical protein LPB140_04255 [Sphingorhabdus lutea]
MIITQKNNPSSPPRQYDPICAILAQLQKFSGLRLGLISHQQRDWQSATFDGDEHILLISAHGQNIKSRLAQLNLEIGDMEFAAKRQFVGEISIGKDIDYGPEHAEFSINILMINAA